MIGFICASCERVCCWHCGTADPRIEEIKTIGSRYCGAPDCVAAERAECGCVECRAGSAGHRKDTGKPCRHRAVDLPPDLAARCPTCNSKPGEKCASLITAKYLDVVHAARRERAKDIP